MPFHNVQHAKKNKQNKQTNVKKSYLAARRRVSKTRALPTTPPNSFEKGVAKSKSSARIIIINIVSFFVGSFSEAENAQKKGKPKKKRIDFRTFFTNNNNNNNCDLFLREAYNARVVIMHALIKRRVCNAFE